MFSKVARLSAIGMMVFLAPLLPAGCVAPDGDGSVTDETPSDETPTDEFPTKLGNAVCSGTIPDFRIETCQSRWPGDSECRDTILSPSDIVPGSVDTAIGGHNGEITHVVEKDANSARQINFYAKLHEGDVFSPGKNTTMYFISWCRF